MGVHTYTHKSISANSLCRAIHELCSYGDEPKVNKLPFPDQEVKYVFHFVRDPFTAAN